MNGRLPFSTVCLLLLTYCAHAEYRDDILHTFLTNRLGGATPSGAGISVSQIEAPEAGSNYVADAGHAEFSGKTITGQSAGSTNVSGHATTVGQYFYGLTTSMAPGISNISAYEASDWAGVGMMQTDTLLAPAVESNRVQNHSWIGAYDGATNLMLRLDHAIERDGFTCVVATDNAGGTNLPQIPSQGYNTLTVGRSDGGHSAGYTTFHEAGRIKPDLVVPLPACSYAAPAVAAAAAFLLEHANTQPSLSAATVPEAIKAILMAGASKDLFPTWNRTASRPLDERYGAGQLNLFNSYRILSAGPQTNSSSNVVSLAGWDVHTTPGATNTWYVLEVPTGRVLSRLSAILVWNRHVDDGPIPFVFDPITSLPNLTLTLHAMSNFSAIAVLDQSSSAVDNVEHLYRHGLPSGQYAMEVTTDSTTRYCLAWEARASVVPEITDIRVTNSIVELSASTTEGSFYALEGSSDLTLPEGGWTPLGTDYAETNIILFVDPAISNSTRRLYRIVADP